METKVTFSDDDLKRLKEQVNRMSLGGLISIEQIPALLARLEAAEKVILEMPSRCYICEENVGTLTLVELFKAWLTSKGEGK